jgi:hypothetical protein
VPPTLQLATECVTALWSRWYGLPARSTRAHLDGLRADAAAALRGSSDAEAALGAFLGAALRLPGVSAALEAGRPGLARELTARLAAPARASMEALREATPPAERTALADLVAADDPFAAALERMPDQPALLPAALDGLRAFVQSPGPLDEPSRCQAAALLERCDAALQQAGANHADGVRIRAQALRELQAIRPLRILAWRTFAEARVLTAAQVTSRLGAGGAATRPTPPTMPPAPPSPHASEVQAGDGAPTDSSSAFYTDVHFPATLPRSRTLWEPLIVRLTTTPQEGSAPAAPVAISFAQEGAPERVEVVVTAPDFEERFGLWQRTLTIWPERDSEPAVFLVRSNSAGRKRITVDFVHRGRTVASVALEPMVTEGEARPGSGRAPLLGDPSALALLATQAPPPADLELRVVLGAERRLTFTLHSARADVGYHWKAVGEVTLMADPADLFEEKFARLSAAAADEAPSPEAAARAQAQLATLGEELWDELLPELFKGTVWPEIRQLQDAGRVRSLLVTSDEPWIPWEMVKPYTRNEVTGDESTEPFWAEQFALARWLAGRGSADRVEVAAARMVAPDLDLAWVDEERVAFEALALHGIQVGAPLQTRSQLQALLSEGGVQLLHLAAHGSFDAAAPNQSRLVLQDGSLTPDDLSPSATRGLRSARPIVFMNACSVGRLGFTPTGLGGWADKWVQTGRVGAFIGTLWEVNDRLAAAFAQHFYARLFDGEPLGEALRSARLAVRALEPGNPTWLAYTLYGDPQSVVRGVAGKLSRTGPPDQN